MINFEETPSNGNFRLTFLLASDGNPETEVAQNSWHMTFQSTVRGYTSFRHKEMGSFFLQIFCHTMEQIGHLSPFSDVLTKTSSMGKTTNHKI